MVYKITCPKCGKRFVLETNNPASLSMNNFICRNCGFSQPFSAMIPGLPAPPPPPQPVMPSPGAPCELKTSLGRSNAAVPSDGHTHVNIDTPKVCYPDGCDTKTKRPTAVFLEVDKPHRRIPLPVGEYILGRDSADSRATVKIAADQYMSRQHAKLVIKDTNGVIRAWLTSLKSTNKVYVNNVQLQPGETFTLQKGDNLLLGATRVAFFPAR